MLIIDGVKYKLWVPQNEEKEFHPIVKEHSIEIFGLNTRFIDISPRLHSEAKIGSEPDGFVIDPVNSKLYLVEVELSKHSPYKHINDQLTRFINGLDNLGTKNIVVEALFDEIEKDKQLKGYFGERITENLYKWLQRLVSNPPIIIVVIEEKTTEVLEACRILMRSYDTRILEFKTFKREDAPTVHAHLFETLAIEEENSTNNPEFYNEKTSKVIQQSKRKEKIKYTEDYHLKDAEKDISAAYQSIKSGILNFDSSVRINPQKSYISLRKNKNFAYLIIRKNKIELVLMVPFEGSGRLIKNHKIISLSQRVQQFYNGPCFEITVENDQEMGEVVEALKEAYKLQAN